jgi:hypothetical protein
MTAAPRLIIVAALLMPAPAMAQPAEPGAAASSERRLSPEQIEAVLAEAAKKREAAERLIDPDAAGSGATRQVHGEAGFSIGTGGHREMFGTGIYRLGDDGAAAISLDFIDLGRRRDKR